MREMNWMFCFVLAVGLGILLRVGVAYSSRVTTAKAALLLSISGLGILTLIQGLLLSVTLTIAQYPDALIPALLAVGLTDLLALGVLLLCYFTRRKRRLTDAQKIELMK